MLSRALSRPCLVYPLASLDVSGQWPVFHADASPNEVSIYINTYTSAKRQSQEAVFKDLAASHINKYILRFDDQGLIVVQADVS